MSRQRGRPRVAEHERRDLIGSVYGTDAQNARIRAAAARLTGGNLRAFLLVAAVEKAEAVLQKTPPGVEGA